MFNHMRELRQIVPARAKKVSKGPMVGFVQEQKLDGERYLLHTGVGGPCLHATTSRRESEITNRMVEKVDRVPHIGNCTRVPGNCVIDTEHAAIGDAAWVELPDWSWDCLLNPKHPHMEYFRAKGAVPVFSHVANTVSIMGSDAGLAIRKQQERGLVWAWCFDVLYWQDKYVGNNPWIKRRGLLASLIEHAKPEEDGIVLMPAWLGLTRDQQQELFERFIEVDGEGMIHKDIEAYYDGARAWYKWKAEWPVDVVLTGNFTYGNAGRTGKMIGLAGNLEIGVYHEGVLKPIGWISAIMDSEAKLPTLTKRAEAGELEGLVVGILCNGLQDKDGWYSLRHPRFYKKVGWRADKNPNDCTLEAIMAELGRA